LLLHVYYFILVLPKFVLMLLMKYLSGNRYPPSEWPQHTWWSHYTDAHWVQPGGKWFCSCPVQDKQRGDVCAI